MFTVYVLRCEHDQYYVGKTHKEAPEINKINKINNEWLKLYKPIETIECILTDDPYKEDNLTKQYMEKYGIESVRNSGSYRELTLEDWQIKALNHEFMSHKIFCNECDSESHFTDDCTEIRIYEDMFESLQEINEEICILNHTLDKLHRLKKIIEITNETQLYKTPLITMTLVSILNLLKTNKSLKPSKSIDIKPFLDLKYENSKYKIDVKIIFDTVFFAYQKFKTQQSTFNPIKYNFPKFKHNDDLSQMALENMLLELINYNMKSVIKLQNTIGEYGDSKEVEEKINKLLTKKMFFLKIN